LQHDVAASCSRRCDVAKARVVREEVDQIQTVLLERRGDVAEAACLPRKHERIGATPRYKAGEQRAVVVRITHPDERLVWKVCA
jgi:hypothetical protein